MMHQSIRQTVNEDNYDDMSEFTSRSRQSMPVVNNNNEVKNKILLLF